MNGMGKNMESVLYIQRQERGPGMHCLTKMSSTDVTLHDSYIFIADEDISVVCSYI